MNYKQWWEQFVSEHDEWRYADSNALRKAAFEAGQESLREQLDASQKREVMLREAIEAELLRADYGRIAMRKALAATDDLDGYILCEKEPVACADNTDCGILWLESVEDGVHLYRQRRPE